MANLRDMIEIKHNCSQLCHSMYAALKVDAILVGEVPFRLPVTHCAYMPSTHSPASLAPQACQLYGMSWIPGWPLCWAKYRLRLGVLTGWLVLLVHFSLSSFLFNLSPRSTKRRLACWDKLPGIDPVRSLCVACRSLLFSLFSNRCDRTLYLTPRTETVYRRMLEIRIIIWDWSLCGIRLGSKEQPYIRKDTVTFEINNGGRHRQPTVYSGHPPYSPQFRTTGALCWLGGRNQRTGASAIESLPPVSSSPGEKVDSDNSCAGLTITSNHITPDRVANGFFRATVSSSQKSTVPREPGSLYAYVCDFVPKKQLGISLWRRKPRQPRVSVWSICGLDMSFTGRQRRWKCQHADSVRKI